MENKIYRASQISNNVETSDIYKSIFVRNSTLVSESTATPFTTEEDVDSMAFLLIPLAVLLSIMILSALVYLMARNRRRFAHIYCEHKSVPHFTFGSDSHSTLIQGIDYDNDDPTECLLKGKLQIDNSYESYRTTEVNTKKFAGKASSHTEIYS